MVMFILYYLYSNINNSDEMTITIKCNCEIPELEGIA